MRLHDESNTNNGRFINADTLHSLQILDDESHPNSHNQGPTKSASGSKEGLSVYGLFRHLARTHRVGFCCDGTFFDRVLT
jgi:hypothetical protein